MSDDGHTDPGSNASARLRTEAIVRHGWWPGWIWAVPIAALLIVGWLGLRYLTRGGEVIQIGFEKAYGIRPQDTDVVYRGVKVGTVTGVALNDKGDAVIVTVAIKDSATKYLRSGTRFWLRGAKPSVSDLSSLGALLSGPTIVMDPGTGKHTTRFAGIPYKPVLPGAPGKPVRYAVSFDAAVGGLRRGEPVSLRGFTVGEVEDVGFRYDAHNGQLSTPVTLALYPALFHIQNAKDPHSIATLRAAMKTLIDKGLRASLDREPPFIGDYRITLKILPGAGPPGQEALIDGLPQIPATPSGGLGVVLSKFEQIPIGQIARNVLDVTHRVDTLVASPKLHDSVVQLDAALADAHRTMAMAGPKLTRLITSLRDTANQLDQAGKTMRRTVGGTTAQTSVVSTLRELTEAARSIRELADYLNRHPESLIKGRTGE
ncbi:MAG: MlaD family protein [Gammaproteobacteria bacterium]